MVDRPNKTETTHTFAATKPETQEWMPTMVPKTKETEFNTRMGATKSLPKTKEGGEDNTRNDATKALQETKEEGDNTRMGATKSLQKPNKKATTTQEWVSQNH
jgi:hypothetical protein